MPHFSFLLTFATPPLISEPIEQPWPWKKCLWPHGIRQKHPLKSRCGAEGVLVYLRVPHGDIDTGTPHTSKCQTHRSLTINVRSTVVIG